MQPALDFLLPEAALKEACTRVGESDLAASGFNVSRLDAGSRQAFLHYILFSDRVGFSRADLPPLTEEGVFYNRYFWFLTFAKRHRKAFGPDAGIEQQAFKLLESAPAGVVWARVERIAQTVDRN